MLSSNLVHRGMPPPPSSYSMLELPLPLSWRAADTWDNCSTGASLC